MRTNDPKRFTISWLWVDNTPIVWREFRASKLGQNENPSYGLIERGCYSKDIFLWRIEINVLHFKHFTVLYS